MIDASALNADHGQEPPLSLRPPPHLRGLAARLGLEPRPDLNPAALANLLPIVTYVVARQVAGTQVAIGVAIVLVVALFVCNRQVGALRVLATITVVLAVIAGAVGVAFNSDFAFLVREPISDLLAAGLLLASMLVRRPLVGLIALEVSPRAMHGQDLRLRLFYQLTVAWLGYVVAMGTLRIFLLAEELSPEAYIVVSRAASWPAAFVLLAVTVVLTARRVRVAPVLAATG